MDGLREVMGGLRGVVGGLRGSQSASRGLWVASGRLWTGLRRVVDWPWGVLGSLRGYGWPQEVTDGLVGVAGGLGRVSLRGIFASLRVITGCLRG
jgi:hypothetical protein